MKKFYIILIPGILMLFVVLLASFGYSDLKSSGGAPAGYTNSPADGQNCSHCMGGTPVAVNGWITSDVPVTGYVPGSTYTITVTATGSGDKGFQVSPQDVAGNLIGTLAAGTGNKLVGSGKYVTHSSAPSGDPTTWNFQWTAPAAGAGSVTFYGSIAVGKLNTKTTTMTVAQSTVGMVESAINSVQVWPNPASEKISLSFSIAKPAEVLVELLDLTGNRVSLLMQEPLSAGNFERNFAISEPAGIYMLRMVSNKEVSLRKLVLR